MKHYKDAITKEIFAFEEDGSQDQFIKSTLIPISDEELTELLAEKRAGQVPESPVDKLVNFLRANPDVRVLLQSK